MLSPARRMTAVAPIHTLAQRQTSAFAATACSCSSIGRLKMRLVPFSPTIGSVPPMANEMKDATSTAQVRRSIVKNGDIPMAAPVAPASASHAGRLGRGGAARDRTDCRGIAATYQARVWWACG